jgi:prepilin-type N-terminal cleavage/methylation domain-containing protein
MHSHPDPRRARQRGYSLFEVMAASIVLSVFILGVGSLYTRASVTVGDVVTRQKAMFVLNAEMERLTTLYFYTNFGVAGPGATDTYESAPLARLIYPASVAAYVPGAGNDFMAANAAAFAANDFLVWRVAGGTANLDRTYVWIDRTRNVMGRLSWATTDIVTPSCFGDDCECFGYSGTAFSESWCKILTLYIEYPYYFVAATGTVITPSRVNTMTLKTIVGRS